MLLIFVCLYVLIRQTPERSIKIKEKMSQMYTVEAIIGKRLRNGVVEYKVKWLGYDLEDCTWQPVKNLSNVKNMMIQYDKTHGKELANVDDIGQQVDNAPEDIFEQNQEIFDENENEDDNQTPDKFELEEETKNICFQESEQIAENAAQKSKSENNHRDTDYDLQIESLSFEDGHFDDQDKELNPLPRKIQKTESSTKKNKCIQKTNQKMSKQNKKYSEQLSQKTHKKSYLQQIEQKTRFIVRAPPKNAILQPQAPMLGQLNVLQISRCNRTNELIYLTKLGPLISYRRQIDMKMHYPDELIKFYESRIEFSQIPKISK